MFYNLIHNFFLSFLHLLQSDTMRIFWAFGDQDVNSDQLGRVHYKNKGIRVIHLLSPMFKKPRAQKNIKQWDVTVKNVRHF